MTIRRIVLSTMLVLGAAACSSDNGTGAKGADTTAAGATSGQASPTSVAATLSTGFFGGAQSAACDADLVEMNTAVELFLAANGTIAVTEDALVVQGMLRQPSVLHDIAADNSVVPSPGGGCVS